MTGRIPSYPNDVKNTFDNLPLFGIDAYDLTIFMAAAGREHHGRVDEDEAAKEKYEKHLPPPPGIEKMWRKRKTKWPEVEYYVTCYDEDGQSEYGYLAQLARRHLGCFPSAKNLSSLRRRSKILKTL